jgi:hypothetical protein
MAVFKVVILKSKMYVNFLNIYSSEKKYFGVVYNELTKVTNKYSQ